jgi:creatinine amidohydrolase/Fe(II)-dependent formamide hydrolase-like protein
MCQDNPAQHSTARHGTAQRAAARLGETTVAMCAETCTEAVTHFARPWCCDRSTAQL